MASQVSYYVLVTGIPLSMGFEKKNLHRNLTPYSKTSLLDFSAVTRSSYRR